MNFSIRQLNEEDLDSSSFLETLSNLSDVKNLDASQAKNVFKRASQDGVYFLVATDDNNEVVSTVKLIIEPKFYHGGKPAGHIEDVVTRQGFEGQGLSQALLQEAIKVAKEQGCYKIILDCKKELIPFYQKSGFTEHDICMRLDINN